jgi:cellulose synthase/poly-beta-1,6-N-acetylglucosamine synthase-like glycosyltransferase
MIKALEILFWTCLILVLYTYIGYGIILFILIRLKRIFTKKKSLPEVLPDDELPNVTLMTCAYNEEDVVDEKMKNTTSLDYPTNKLQQIWVTDGSDDNTNKLLKKYSQVKIIFKPEREGKTAALNHGMDYVKTPITIFTDANTLLNRDAVRELINHFQDATVGCVSGEKRVYTRHKNDTAGKGEGLYWKYESKLKKWDSELYSTMGAAGELFAIRTELYKKMPTDTLLDDFIISMEIVENGMRIGYTDKAYAMEYGSINMEEESKRKCRIAAGGLQSINRLRPLLNPFNHFIATFQYISHRVLRWSITPFAMFILVPANVLLLFFNNNVFFTTIWILQIIFYTAAFAGFQLNKRGIKHKILYVPYYFMFMNINVFRGIKYLKDQKGAGAWEKAKRQ